MYRLTVMSTLMQQPIIGQDSMILAFPAAVIHDEHGARLTDVLALRKQLSDLSRESAAKLGLALHHADWVATEDPDTVREIGLIHGCARCIASVDQSLAWLRQHPGEELLCGIVYWAAPT